MKTRLFVSCLVGSGWLLACGSEAPPDEPPDDSAPEDEVVVIATADAVTSAGGAVSGSSASGVSGDTSRSDGTSGTASVDSSAGGASAISGGAAADANTTAQAGSSGAAGASAATEGSGGASANTAGEADADSATSDGADASTTGQASTTGDVPPLPAVPLGAVLITEYVESGGDKAIELSNLSTNPLVLAECRLETYFNGKLESTSGVDLGFELGPGQSWVLCNSNANSALLAICDQPSSINFNGDDALVLRCDGVVHDSFGQVGFDPGNQWQTPDSAGGADSASDAYGSADHVLRRRCGALPRTDPELVFEVVLAADWVSIREIEGVTTTSADFEGLGLAACAVPNDAGSGEGTDGTAGAAAE